MIEGGWSFVWAAYALTGGALGLLALIIMWRSRHWAKRAREIEQRT